MKFKGKPVGEFRADAHWTGKAVELTLNLRNHGSFHPVHCRVPGEVLQDSKRDGRPLDESEAMRLCERFEDRIKQIIVGKLMADDVDDDGAVTIRSADLSQYPDDGAPPRGERR
jgi:hypothetical protein